MAKNPEPINLTDKYILHCDGRVYSKFVERFLATYLSQGYPTVKFNKTASRIHVLVAEHFVSNPDPDKFTLVNHKDGDKLNSYYTNLEWTDVSGNNYHAHNSGMRTYTTSRAVKRTDPEASLSVEYTSVREAERKTGLSQHLITTLCSTNRKDNSGCTWEYTQVQEVKTQDKAPLNGIPIDDTKAYLITPCGKLFSVKSSRYLKQKTTQDGYKEVTTSHAGKGKTHLTHRLVACAFLGQPTGDKMQVNHKNSDKADNRIENLEWTSPSENTRHSVEFGKLSVHQKTVQQIDPKTLIVVNRFDSIEKASIFIQGHASNISVACSQKCVRYGYYWLYEDDSDTALEKLTHVRRNRVAVDQLDQTGAVIAVFQSIKEAADTIGGCRKRLQEACAKQKEYQGFIWRYTDSA